MYGTTDVIKSILDIINKKFCTKPLLTVYAWNYQRKAFFSGMKTISKDFLVTLTFPMNLTVVF